MKRLETVLVHALQFVFSICFLIMLALIVITCMAGVRALTQETANSYNRSSDAIQAALDKG